MSNSALSTQKQSNSTNYQSFEGTKRLIIEKIKTSKYNKKTKENMLVLFGYTGEDGIFGRKEIETLIKINNANAGNLIKRLDDLDLIEKVSGHGKGKYKFIKQERKI